jgi:hypothetical protein
MSISPSLYLKLQCGVCLMQKRQEWRGNLQLGSTFLPISHSTQLSFHFSYDLRLQATAYSIWTPQSKINSQCKPSHPSSHIRLIPPFISSETPSLLRLQSLSSTLKTYTRSHPTFPSLNTYLNPPSLPLPSPLSAQQLPAKFPKSSLLEQRILPPLPCGAGATIPGVEAPSFLP